MLIFIELLVVTCNLDSGEMDFIKMLLWSKNNVPKC